MAKDVLEIADITTVRGKQPQKQCNQRFSGRERHIGRYYTKGEIDMSIEERLEMLERETKRNRKVICRLCIVLGLSIGAWLSSGIFFL